MPVIGRGNHQHDVFCVAALQAKRIDQHDRACAQAQASKNKQCENSLVLCVSEGLYGMYSIQLMVLM